jgi:hypothetical protein
MIVITQRSLIRDVAKRWKLQYRDARSGTDKIEVGRKLAMLDGETASADAVNAIIGNSSWTQVPKCDECGASREVVVQLGEEPDYESHTACICVECLRKAVTEAEGAQC